MKNEKKDEKRTNDNNNNENCRDKKVIFCLSGYTQWNKFSCLIWFISKEICVTTQLTIIYNMFQFDIILLKS